MADSYVLVPDDGSFTLGKKVRSQTRTVGADEVHEHYFILTDETDDRQARVLDSAPASGDAGLVTRNIPSGTQTITGSVTANAGTNLNTSALALESGGNLAAAAASLSVLDDWDESDRAKMNPIVGQAGVAAGAGAVGTTTQRMTLASDDPAVTSLQLIDDTIFTDDTSTHATGTTKGVGIMAVATPTDAAVNANDIGMPAMSLNRALHALLQANSGVDIGDVDVTSIIPGTGATNLGKAEDAIHGSGDTGVFCLAVANEANTTFAADADYVPFGTDREGSTRNIGNRAHDAIDAGAPLKMGFQARTTNPTAVADADRVNGIADDLGRQVAILNGVRDLISQNTTTITASTSETTILSAVASTFHDVVCMVLTNTSTTGTRIDIRDATAGTVRKSIFLVPGGSAVEMFVVPFKQTTVNNNWTAQCSVAVTDVRIFVMAVQNI